MIQEIWCFTYHITLHVIHVLILSSFLNKIFLKINAYIETEILAEHYEVIFWIQPAYLNLTKNN